MLLRIKKRRNVVAFLLITGFIALTLYGCTVDRKEPAQPAGSEPLAESRMLDLSVESEYMGRSMPVRVYLPKGYGSGQKYPVWYGLHGSSSDESMWSDAGITALADQLIDSGEISPMIMVFPFVKDDALKEFNRQKEEYGKLGERYIDRYISSELVSYIDSGFDTNTASK